MPQVTFASPSKASVSAKLEELNGLVYDYLEVSGLDKAMRAFSTECEAKSIPFPTRKTDSKPGGFTRSDADHLLQCFDDGDLDGFMKLWNIFLRHVQLSSGDEMKKLEVYIRVRFVVRPQEGGQCDQSIAMAALKTFFEENSVALASDSSILPLFALPFVKNPKEHLIFHELFEPAWEQRLRSQLNQTLSKYFELLQENIENYSKLASIVWNSYTQRHPNWDSECDKPKSVSNTANLNMTYHTERFFQLATTYRKVRKLLRGTRESYGKLLKVTNELMNALELALNGENVTLEPVIQKCYKVFPEIFTSNIASGKPDKEYFKKLTSGAIFDTTLDSDVSLFFVGISNMSPDCLDFTKIKSTLSSESNVIGTADKLCLLQSLRWLLTKCSPTCRIEVMDSFVQADLLGLNPLTPSGHREKLFSCLLSPNPTYLKECFARFLNSISSIKAGRSYLASTNYTLKVLVQSLHTFKGSKESFICQMVVATLQKLSLRKQMRLGMIELNVIEWLVVYLKAELTKNEGVFKTLPDFQGLEKSQSLSYNQYFMEYAWALLMNLCLHEESSGSTARIASDILTCIVQMLLAKPNPDVGPCVISTLYSLLRNPDIFAMAKHMRLQNTFFQIVCNDTTELSGHLNHLITVLTQDGYDRVSTSGEVDYDDDDNNDPDEFEPEIEVVETWAAALNENTATGDDLLVRHYMTAKAEIAVVPKTSFPLSTTTLAKQGVYLRPVTPHKNAQKSANPSSIPKGVTPEVRGKKPNTTKTGEIAKKANSSHSTTLNRGTTNLNLNFPGSKQKPKRQLQPKVLFSTAVRARPVVIKSSDPGKSSDASSKSKTKNRKISLPRSTRLNSKGVSGHSSKSLESSVEAKLKFSGVKQLVRKDIPDQKTEKLDESLSSSHAASTEMSEAELPKRVSRSSVRYVSPVRRIQKISGMDTYFDEIFTTVKAVAESNSRAKPRSKSLVPARVRRE